MLNHNHQYYLYCVSKALDIADELSLSSISEKHNYYSKGNRDFALEVDQEIERRLKSLLFEYDQEIPTLGEEFSWDGSPRTGSQLFWVIDPIDGTVNYSRNLPLFGTSVALIYQNQPIVAGISFPLLKERYTAIQGGGAYLNNSQIYVSNTSEISQAIIGFGDFAVGEQATEKNELRYEMIKYYGNQALRIRMPGTAALQLAWLACGKIDISITLSNNSWDVQAGVLLVREAGGNVFDCDGSEHSVLSKYTLATNSKLKNSVLDFFST